MNQCHDSKSSCSLLAHSLCVGDVSPAGLCRFGWWSTLALPRYKRIWEKFDVLIVFGQGEQGAAAWVALWQGQSQVCVLCLERRKLLCACKQPCKLIFGVCRKISPGVKSNRKPDPQSRVLLTQLWTLEQLSWSRVGVKERSFFFVQIFWILNHTQ